MPLVHVGVEFPMRMLRFLPVLAALWAAPAMAEALPDSARSAVKRLTLTLTGDVGLNQTLQPAVSAGAIKHGRVIPWAETTQNIKHLLDSDIVFGNLETVVTDRNAIRAVAKEFNFRTHPAGLRHLVASGFNLFSTANNHSMDYGSEGAADTLRFLDEMKQHGLLAHAGIGSNAAAAARPAVFERSSMRIAFSAIGITGSRAGPSTPGPLGWRAAGDWEAITANLAAEAADLRILSIHQGSELDTSVSAFQIDRFRTQAAIDRGIDLVVGHHQHVAAGVEMVEGRLVFYGLGNFLHLGTQDMSRMDPCRDYGLAARVHIVQRPGERPEVIAVEAVPVQGMHLQPRVLEPAAGRARIALLNGLSSRLDDDRSNARGLRFVPRSDGTGLFCTAAAQNDPSRIGEECKALAESAGLAAPVETSCSRTTVAAAGGPLRRLSENKRGSEGSTPKQRHRSVASAPLSVIFD